MAEKGNWKGGYREDGGYDGVSEYDRDGNYVGTLEDYQASAESSGDGTDSEDPDAQSTDTKDPENEEVKHAERALWEKIYKKSGQGRRTGVGITAEGDMLAALGLRYGTEEATEFSEKVHKTVALGAYRSSVEMAKDRRSDAGSACRAG